MTGLGLSYAKVATDSFGRKKFKYHFIAIQRPERLALNLQLADGEL